MLFGEGVKIKSSGSENGEIYPDAGILQVVNSTGINSAKYMFLYELGHMFISLAGYKPHTNN